MATEGHVLYNKDYAAFVQGQHDTTNTVDDSVVDGEDVGCAASEANLSKPKVKAKPKAPPSPSPFGQGSAIGEATTEEPASGQGLNASLADLLKHELSGSTSGLNMFRLMVWSLGRF